LRVMRERGGAHLVGRADRSEGGCGLEARAELGHGAFVKKLML
jgi:hypothetical protein